MSEARKGKIARIPYAIRTALNTRIRDGQPGSKILPWLNALPRVREALIAHFNSEPISDANLSAWRAGGYQYWLLQQERMDRIRSLSQLALDMAKAAGGSPSEPACAIAGGRIMEVLESISDDDLAKLLPAITALRNAESKKIAAQAAARRADVSEKALSLAHKKWAWRAAETILDALSDRLAKAQEIAASSASRSDKIAQLVNAFFDQ